MIHHKTVEVVYPLADMLQEKQLRAKAIAGTPLAELVASSHYSLPTQGFDESLLDPVELVLKGSSTKGLDGVVNHDMVLEEVVGAVSETVKNNLNVARNVVNPIIKETVEDLQEYIRNAESVLKGDISVRPDFWNDVWNSPTLDGMVERYSETPFQEVRLSHVIGEGDDFTVEDFIHTGSTSFDESVDQLVLEIGLEKTAHLFQRAFGRDGTRDPMLTPLLNQLSRNEALLLHLMARRLVDNPPADVNLSLSGYNAYIAQIIAQSGNYLNVLRKKRIRAQNQKILVSGWPLGREVVGRQPIEIVVNGDLYPQFLKEGGSPEAIIGCFITTQDRYYDRILEEKDALEKAWDKQHRILITRQRLDRFNHAVAGLRLAVAKQINDLDDDIVPVTKDILHRKLEKNLSSLYGRWYEKPYEYARKVICDTIFPHTMSLQILCAIDHVSEDHPDLDVREAALLAVIEIVSGWVAKLCTVEPTGD